MYLFGGLRRRALILEALKLDLEALNVLAADYEAANMPCAAAELRRRLEYYQKKGISIPWITVL